jgi:parallel beta-helix repeat protein
VEILPGEYREQVRLKIGVHVKSSTPLSAVLRAAPASAGPAVLAMNASGARLSGVRILGDQEAPLAAGIVLDHSDMEVDGVEIRGARTGVEIRGGKPSITGSTITDSAAEGIVIVDSARPWIAHNIFRGNKGKDIAVREESRPILSDNSFDKIALDLPAGESMDTVRQRNSFPAAPRPVRRQP